MKMKTKATSPTISLLDRIRAVKRREYKTWISGLSKKDLDEIHQIIEEYHNGLHPNLGGYSLATTIIEHYSLSVKPHTVFMYIRARTKDSP